ncbi:MAG: oligosaccharide flippase family protein [Flavobacteriia bacterium]|nr:oligosaccharide flippase family protein [Flavobacteriia bacterium]
MVLTFLIYRIANQKLSDIGFSEYNIFRRTNSLILPLLMIGLGVAVPRFVSMDSKRNTFFLTGIIWISISSIIILLTILIGIDFFSFFFYGDIDYKVHIILIGFLVMTFGFHSIIYGFLRGKHKLYFSNIIQVINIGFIPFFVFFITEKVVEIIFLNFILMFSSCIIVSIIILFKFKIKFVKNDFINDSKILLKFGLPRVIGDFALLALLSLPTYIILNLNKNLIFAGDIAYGITLLNLFGAFFSPLSIVLLPEISKFLINKDFNIIKKRFRTFFIVSLLITLILYLIFFFFTDFILTFLLGDNYNISIIKFSQIILSASFGYVLYIILRSFLDAIYFKANNSINLLIILMIYLTLVFIGKNFKFTIDYYLYSYVISLSLLGLITLYQTNIAIKKLK